MKNLKKIKNNLLKRIYKPHLYINVAEYCKPKQVHFVGIGGVSMSSLALYALKKGCIVSGSDLNNSQLIEDLKSHGITIFLNHVEENVLGKDLVVYSNATECSVEVLKAKELGIKTISRAEYLARFLNDYHTRICVAGAHGKTTTTALIYAVLKEAMQEPALHLGGNYVQTKKSYDFSNGNCVVCEACEYKDSFLKLKPTIGVVLNIALEHLDYFKTFDNVKNSFQKFADKASVVVANCECNINTKNLITFGLKNANYTAKRIKLQKNGKYSFKCYKNKQFFMQVELNLLGRHNVLNALATIAVCDYLKIAKMDIFTALQNFCGVERRFEFLHKDRFIVHDYAHHPDEIKAVLKEVKKIYKDKLLVVFQPHTYSRTKTLMVDFVKTFSKTKEMVVLETYSAREEYDEQGSAQTLAKNIGNKATYLRFSKDAEEYILHKIGAGYGVLFFGAGNIYDMAKNVSKMC